jgi:hypothetical protein
MSKPSRQSRTGFGLLALALCAGCATGPTTQTSYRELSFFTIGAGLRYWDCSWEPVDEPLTIQASYTYEPEVWPVGIETALQWSFSDESLEGSGLTSDNFEFSLGATKSFFPVSEKLIWTFGAGVAFTYSTERLSVFVPGTPSTQDTNSSDFWPGVYGHTRLAWKFSPTLDVGVDLRGLYGADSVRLIGPVRDGQYVQVTMGLGIHR